MAGTFSQIYIQYVFAVQGRENLISNNWKNELYKYISGIVTNKKQKLIAINGMPDHIHVFVGLKPVMAPSDLLRDIKTIRPILPMKRNLSEESFRGRRGMVCSPIRIRI